MKYLALDQASIITGYSIFDDKGIAAYGTFKAKKKDLPGRLVEIRNKILELIDKYEIESVYYEDIQMQDGFNNNVVTFKILAEVIGVVTETCKEHNIPCDSVPPVVWKAAIGIPTRKKRDFQKALTQQYVKNTYSIEAVEDACDAIGLGTYVYSTFGNKIHKMSKEEQNIKDDGGISWTN